MKKNDKQRLFEVMQRLDKTFKPKLKENIENKKTFILNLWGEDDEVYFKFDKYKNNDALAVELMSTDGESYAMVSLNVPESAQLPKDEFFLKDWSENEPVAKALIEMKAIIPTGKRTGSGFIVAKSYKISPEYYGNNTNLNEENSDDFFEITTPIGSEDEKLLVGIVNQGIDSHLEGFTKSKFDVRKGSLGDRRVFNFHKSELPVLLRRLEELGTEDALQWKNDIENYDSTINEIN